ncbi:alkaline phosphatase family protein [Sphaerimonospora mesophila]|uniref:alkaline phosphatase family protein n=1 Tax=Sphaerimonospora mesophila TaxID=37483 RepID=UPI0006E32D5A
MTVYWMVWDAAAPWIVDRLDAEGQLPAVRRLRTAGVFAAARPPAPNCQTPPSLATLFTGTWPDEHGVTGFRVPSATGRLGDSVSGFARSACRRPAVWETAGRSGLRTTAVHVPWVADTVTDTGTVPEWLDAATEAYSRRLARHGAHELGVAPLTFPVAHHELVAVADGPGVRVRGRHGEAHVTDVWTPLMLDADTGIWLRQAQLRDRRLLLHTGAWSPRTVGHDMSVVAALREAPPFAGEALGSCYRAGTFGSRLVDGGDGSAEDLFLSSVRLVGRGFGAAIERALAHHSSDLVVLYLPTTDDVGHELLGWCDERSAAYRPDEAPEVWRRIARCYRQADGLLGRVLNRAGENDTVVLCADHGMAGTAWTLHPNQLLLDAGLAVTDTAGRLDPERSAAYYHPVNNGSLWINGSAGRRGPPSREETDAIAATVRGLLTAVCTPGTDRPLVQRLLPSPDGRRMDLLFDADCLPSADLSGGASPVHGAAKPGAHVTNGGDDRLHALFAAAGPGLPGGSDLGVIDNTWPAELVLQQLTATHTDRSASHV